MSTDYSQYTPGQSVQVTCTNASDSMEVYDVTDGEEGALSIGNGGAAQGNFPCDPGVVDFVGIESHTYTFVELDPSASNCVNQYYLECKSQDSFIAEATITIVAETSGSPSFGLSKSTYAPNEPIFFSCQSSGHSLELYDLTSGVDDVLPSGSYPCSSGVLIIDAIVAGSYALLEVALNRNCSGLTYMECLHQDYFWAEYNFSVQALPGLAQLLPSVTILAPRAGDAFSYKGAIEYSTLNTERVNLYYSSMTSNKELIVEGAPIKGPYVWNTLGLIAGNFYQLIIDAFGSNGSLTQVVSDLFSLDFTAPTFVIKVNPPVTRGSDVTVSVDASENLKSPPTVTVTQTGASPVPLTMKGQGSHFEGVYVIAKGFDGVATVSVSGSDKAGNSGTSILSGGTFAVGINPPPSPRITSPQNNQIVATSTVAMAGTLRSDTTAVLTVNGADTYTAVASSDGKFSIPTIRLSKDINRGLNVLSVAARDQAGLLSPAVPVYVKYNFAPTAGTLFPKKDTTISTTTSLTVWARDDNGDPLLFTYQIISAAHFDATQSATSTKNEWTTIGDAIPSISFSWDSTEVEDGQYFLRVIADDTFAKSYSTSTPFTIRNTLPFFRFEDGRKTLTNKSSVTIAGRAFAPNNLSPRPTIKTVEYSIDSGVNWIVVPLASGRDTPEARFSVALSGLKEGAQAILWRVKDSRGFYGRANHPVVFDAIAPKAPIVNTPANNAFITSDEDENVSRSGLQISISGAAESQSMVRLETETGVLTTKALANGDFVFRSVDVAQRGAHQFKVTASDEAGNISVASIVNVLYDNPPTLSFLTPKPFRGLTGNAVVSWKIEDRDRDPIGGVTLAYRKGQGAFTSLPIDPSKNSLTFDVSKFSEAPDYELRLTASDGMASSTDTVRFAVDRTAPTLSSLTLDTSVLGVGGALTAHGTAQDSLSGIEYVEYAVAEGEPTSFFTTLLTKGFLQENATFSIKHPAKIPDGTFTLYARAVDAAGNVSPLVSRAITVDTSPPHVGTFDVLAQGVRVTPDDQGAITLYKGMETLFEVSLEGDTASASLVVGDSSIPLERDIVSGLWQATLHSGEMEVPIHISASDNVQNALADALLGSLVPIEHGSVMVLSEDGSTEPLPDTKIKVLVLAEGATQFTSYSGSVVVTGAQGEYSLALPQGTYKLGVEAKGYHAPLQDLVLPHAGFVNVSFSVIKYRGIRGFFQRISDYLFAP